MKLRTLIVSALVLLCIIGLSTPGLASAQDNLITNGDFSDNLTGWNEVWAGFSGPLNSGPYPPYPASTVNGYLDLGMRAGYHYVTTDYIPVCSANLTLSCLFRPVSWATESDDPIGIVAVIVYLHDDNDTPLLGSLYYYFSPSHDLSSTATTYYEKLGTGDPIPPDWTSIDINILDVLTTNSPPLTIDPDAITRIRVGTYAYGTEVDGNYTVGYFDDFVLSSSELGTINIIKELVGETPDSDWEFTGDLAFTIAPGGGSHTSDNLTPGEYNIFETLKDGYWLDISCDNCTNCTYDIEDGVTIDLGLCDNVTCTFTNRPTGTVNIIKEVVGTAPTDNWTFSGAVSFEFLPSGGTYTHENLTPQTYLYREDTKDGYALSVNCINCQDWYPWKGSYDNGVVVDVGSGDNATCTFTNTMLPGTINIIKELVGEAPDSDWAFTGSLNFTIAPGGGSHTSDNLTPGEYNITETLKDGYATSVSCSNCDDCTYTDDGVTIDLGPSDNVTCTFTNTAEAQPPPPPIPSRIVPPSQSREPRRSSPSTGLCCQPQDLHVKYLKISQQQAYVGEPLTILANVVNDGIETCTYDVTLAINNKVEQTKSISISPSSAYHVEFTVIKHEPGKYNVAVNGQRTNFTIFGTGNKTSGSPPIGMPIAIITITVLALVVLATAVILVLNYRRTF